jgi:hypothetical protein
MKEKDISIRPPEFESNENMPPLPINGLLYPVDMDDRRVIEAFKFVVEKVINEMGGVPAKIETTFVQEPYTGALLPRIVASFETDNISDTHLEGLDEISARAYGEDITKIRYKQGKSIHTHLYPKMDARNRDKTTIDTTLGWYTGQNSGNPNRTYKGIFVYRKIGKKDIASGLRAREDSSWFTQNTLYDNSGKPYNDSSYLIEIREGGMFNGSQAKVIDGPYQTDLAETIVLTSLLLAGKELPPAKPGLVYNIYHEMNQLGLGPATDLPGLEEQIELVERTLIVPLANPELTRSLKGEPKSVGLIGQVGTGKTQIIKHFLRQKLGIMLVPVNSGEFEDELRKKAESRRILPRIREVSDKVGRNVVLIIEDLENLAHKDNSASKILLNELAGLYNSGYRVLWTTNHPEVFNPQLLEPERLGGRTIFCGLPTEKARRLILNQHLVSVSRTRKLPVFDPNVISSKATNQQEARNLVLQAVAASTPGFSPRYLKDIVIEAVDQFIYRIAKEKGVIHGLTEEDLTGRSFIIDDWYKALREVYEVYDTKSRLEEDERLRKHIKPGSIGKKGDIGFANREKKSGSVGPIVEFDALLKDTDKK